MDSVSGNLFIYPKLPARGFGLGNMLFVWARAAIAGSQADLPILAPSWFKPFRVGPWFRRERDKRYYLNDFTNDGYIKGLPKYRILFASHRVGEEKLNQVMGQSRNRSIVIEFSKLDGYFRPLLSHREFLRQELMRVVNRTIRDFVTKQATTPYIGVHIRRGDFVRLGQHIPLQWYKNAAVAARNEFGGTLQIRIFSDAPPSSLAPFSSLENTTIMPPAPAVQDILLLACASVIIGTSLSTFSLWASFLGANPTLWPPVSPGVYGYGLHMGQHIATNWDGKIDRGVRYF